MASIRQQQIGKIVQVAISEILQKEAREVLSNALVTVVSVKVTPDLLIARVYLSIYNTPNPNDVIHLINQNQKAFRGLLGKKIRNKVRSIPELEFFRDDTMDEVVQMDKLFKEIKKKDEEIEELRKHSDYEDTNPYKEEI